MSQSEPPVDETGRAETGPPGPPRTTVWQSIRMGLHILQVRLRFAVVFVIAFVVVGRWEVLRNYWDSLTRTAGGVQTGLQAVSNDTEYFCPMDPGVVSDWPGKCSICNMALVRRKKGEATPLPNGIVARMQFSPYRLQLAGIRTSPVTYQPLERELITVGRVTCDQKRLARLMSPRAGVVKSLIADSLWTVVKQGDPLLTLRSAKADRGEQVDEPTLRSPLAGRVLAMHVRDGDRVEAGTLLVEVSDLTKVCVLAEIFEKDIAFVSEGQSAEVTSEAFQGRPACEGVVRAVRALGPAKAGTYQVTIETDNPGQDILPEMGVMVRIKTSIDRVEPFRSFPSDPSPIKQGEPREIYTCEDHPEVVRERSGRCAIDGAELERRELAGNQRIRWWCPMHPEVTDDRPGSKCQACGGMILVPRVIAYRPPGQVLAVPELAVVDTGSKTVVYVEKGPGMFDGVEVILGPRCGDLYPVIQGLDAGQRVATVGAFLIDAETRLNPSVAASYFGAGRSASPQTDRRRTTSSSASKTPSAPATVDPSDQALVARQKVCPVTGKALGSMGIPVRVVIDGEAVFLCCEGCEGKLRQNPEKYLSNRREEP